MPTAPISAPPRKFPRRYPREGALDLQRVGSEQDLDWMQRCNAGAMRDLPPAGLAVTHCEMRTRFPHGGEQATTHVHGDVVLLALEPIGPGDAAAFEVE